MFSAINSERFLNHWSPESLKKRIDNERKKIKLPSSFRSLNESALIYKMLTTHGRTTRFYNKESIIENIAEVIFRTKCTNTQAINIIKANLDFLPALRTREAVNLMLHMLIDPNAFEDAMSGYKQYIGKSISLKNKEKIPEYREEEFETYFNVRKPAPLLRIYDLLPAQKEAVSLYCTVFAKPEDINVLFHHLLQTFHAKLRANNSSPHALAAFIHNGIIAIHPFADGNGRIARFMMNKVFDLYGLKQLDPKDQTQPGDQSAERRYDKAVASEDDNVLVEWIMAEHRALRTPAPRRNPVMHQHPLLQNQPICLETENLAKKILAFSIWKQAVKEDATFQATPLGEFLQSKGY